MKKLTLLYFSLPLFLALIMSFNSCGTKKGSLATNKPITNANHSDNSSLFIEQEPLGFNSKMLRPIVIYATRADYSALVPVTLDASGSSIASYPSRNDLKQGEGFTSPIPLDGGYLYDRRGLSPHSAFLSISYEYYTSLEEDPSPSWLSRLILDKDPFTFLAICNREELKDESPSSLNTYINKGFPGARILIDKRSKK